MKTSLIDKIDDFLTNATYESIMEDYVKFGCKVELDKKKEFDYLKECVTTFMKTNDRLDMSQFFDQGLAFGLDFANNRINVFGEYHVFHIDYKLTSDDKKIWLGYSVSTIDK